MAGRPRKPVDATPEPAPRPRRTRAHVNQVPKTKAKAAPKVAKVEPEVKYTKKDNPAFMQVTFRIPMALSSRMDVYVMNCKIESQKTWRPDRSDIVRELLEVLFALEDKHGAVKAMELIKGLVD